MSWKLRCTCPHLGKAEPFVCDLVQFRRVCRGMAVHTEVAGAKVVGEKDENCDGGTVEPLLAAPWLPAVLQCSQSKVSRVAGLSQRTVGLAARVLGRGRRGGPHQDRRVQEL